MYNRWFHPPELHSPGPGEERRVGWIELFYDLVYVASIIQLGTALSKHPDWAGFLIFAGLFAAIWYAWTGFTFYSNRFLVDDSLHRLLVFVKMFGIASMAVLAPGVFEGETRSFALAYVLVRLCIVLFYVRARFQAERGRELSGRFAVWFSFGAAVWLVSAFVPQPWVWLLWGFGLTVELSAPVTAKLRALAVQYPPDAAHMAERYGLLTIIVLGESFVKVLTDLAAGTASASWGTVGLGGLALAITCSVWWIYFDDVVHSRIRRKRGARFLWIYGHLPLAIAITSLGVGIKKAVGTDPDVTLEAARWLLTGSLGLVFASVALLDWVTEREESHLDDLVRVWLRLGSMVVVLGIGAVGDLITNRTSLILVAAVCAVQVIADLVIAPQSMGHPDHEHLQSSFGIGEMEEDVRRREKRRAVRDPLSAVLRGTPSGLRRGLYFFFMAGSWARLLGAAVVAYLALNLLYAVLYLFEPGSIDGGATDSLADAFFFSVQTFSTIGYGVLSPGSAWADTLVVAEAVTGVLFVALITGLVFAKASRPQASVLFSEVVTFTRFEGRRALMLRLGNARGNEVVEASIRVSALCDEVTEDGHTLRRVRDLELVRSNQPLFALTWMVIHPIDEGSPLYGVDESNPGKLVGIVATMTGYDGTYAQTIHARKSWYPEDVRWNQRFVDVLSEMADGRTMVDYRRFHETVGEG